MIQDIFPHRLDHAFRDREPVPEDWFFSFRGGEVLRQWLTSLCGGHR